MLAEAQRCHPHEACGILLGDGSTITQARATANRAADQATRFEIDAAALIAAHRAARAGGPQVMGYFHAHPHGLPCPSPTDAAAAARDGRIWAIVAGAVIGWWRDGESGFEPLSTRVVDG